MVISELISKLGFEIDHKALHELDESLASIKEGILGLSLEFAGVGGALYEVVKGTAEAGFQAKNAALSVGMTVDEYTRLTFAAKESGVAQESLSTALFVLSGNMEQARRGSSEAIQTLQQMGLPIGKVMNGTLKLGDALGYISERFKKLQDQGSPRLTGIAREGLGRSGAQLIPFLTQGKESMKELGAESDELGMTFTEADAALSKGFIISLERLEMFFVGLKREIGLGLMPEFKKIIDSTYKWLKAHREVIKENIAGFIKGLTGFLKAMAKPMAAIADSAMGYIKLFGGAEQATKLFLIAMSALFGASVLYGLGQLLMAVGSIVLTLALGELPVLLLGAAFVALGLAIDDIYGYLHGKKSITGLIVDWLKGSPEITENWNKIEKVIVGAIDRIAAKIKKEHPYLAMLAHATGMGIKWAGDTAFEAAPQPTVGHIEPKGWLDKMLDKYGPKADFAKYGLMPAPITINQQNHFPAGTPADMADRVGTATRRGVEGSPAGKAATMNTSGAAN